MYIISIVIRLLHHIHIINLLLYYNIIKIYTRSIILRYSLYNVDRIYVLIIINLDLNSLDLYYYSSNSVTYKLYARLDNNTIHVGYNN